MTEYTPREVVRRAEYRFEYHTNTGAVQRSALFVNRAGGDRPGLDAGTDRRRNLFGLGLRISRLYEAHARGAQLRTAHSTVDLVTWGNDGERLLDWYSVGDTPELVPLPEHFFGYAAVTRSTGPEQGVEVPELVIARQFPRRAPRFTAVLAAALRPIALDALRAGQDLDAPFSVHNDFATPAGVRACWDLDFSRQGNGFRASVGTVVANTAFLGANLSPPAIDI